MNKAMFLEQLRGLNGIVMQNISLRELTSWKIGGLVDWYIRVETVQGLQQVINALSRSELPWILLGSGTNTLFSDDGFRGVIVQLGIEFQQIEVYEAHKIRAGSAANLMKVCRKAQESGLVGLERLAGIPGTVGAAAYLNAGAFGQNLLDRCSSLRVTAITGESRVLTQISSNYRKGFIPRDSIITQVEFDLEPGNPQQIDEEMKKYLQHRAQTQPLDQASAGCTFKNPMGTGAGRLIDEAGLKGYRIGGASISEKHANFIINDGSASCQDILDLIRHVQTHIATQYNVFLDIEIHAFDEMGNNPGIGRIEQ